ncbi:ferredoxin Fer [Halomarina litorea]|uniref:ferredoxin Fer n=1 Tax=Halomarina litorea TaxID=2961595 RepID=UPI0020C57D2B|nr:ferredoxin Fer [Halomarina sp. BCD28]
MESPFDVLAVDSDADDDEVERAYRQRVLEAHPDHGGTASEFQQVRRAYERIQSGYDPEEADEFESEDAGDAGVDADDPESNGEVDDAEPDGVPTEFLNYDVLADHGWELNDEDLFEKAAAANLDPDDHGQFTVGPRESVLEAAEADGNLWPYACRGGACTNCAVAVVEGELPPPANHILPQGMIDQGIRLSCVTQPVSDELKVVYNVKHLPGLDELRLPPSRFDKARFND